jgi:hypothetical protein
MKLRAFRTGATRLLLLSATLFAGHRAIAGDTAPATIPAVHGEALNGAKVELPSALKGKVGVLIVSFSQASRNQVTDWDRRLAADFRDSGTVTYFALPVLESVPRILRGFVIGKVRDSVPDQARARFVPVLDHEADWRKLSAYQAPDDAYVLLVDGTGTLRWKIQGAVSDASYGQLKQKIVELQSGTRQASPTTSHASPAHP